jgi:hypothetical protein
MKQGQIIEQAKGKVGKDKVVDTLKDSNVFRCEGGTGHTKRYWLKEPEEMASEAEPENPVPEEPVPEQPPLPGQAPPLEPVSCLIF